MEIPEDVTLAEEYNSVEDIAQSVIEYSAEAQNVSQAELDIIPITAIDEAEMPRAIENPDDISQNSWDRMRDLIKGTVESKGFSVN